MSDLRTVKIVRDDPEAQDFVREGGVALFQYNVPRYDETFSFTGEVDSNVHLICADQTVADHVRSFQPEFDQVNVIAGHPILLAWHKTPDEVMDLLEKAGYTLVGDSRWETSLFNAIHQFL